MHFAGHGDAEADPWLLDERGGRAAMPAEAIASIFRAMRDDVRLVVLNACFAAEIDDALGEVRASDSVVASSNEDGLVILRYGFLHELRGARAGARVPTTPRDRPPDAA